MWVKLAALRYSNQRLFNYSYSFSANADYVFYAQSVLPQIQSQNQTSIAMRKMSGNLNVSAFRNYRQSVDQFVRNDRGFLSASKIRGTPAYWKKIQSEF